MEGFSVAQLATELDLPVTFLLKQLKAAGISKEHESESVSEKDKAQLVEYLRQKHANKIMSARGEAIEIEKSDSTELASTVQVEVREHRVITPEPTKAFVPVQSVPTNSTQREGNTPLNLNKLSEDFLESNHNATIKKTNGATSAREAAAKLEKLNDKKTEIYNGSSFFSSGDGGTTFWIYIFLWWILIPWGIAALIIRRSKLDAIDGEIEEATKNLKEAEEQCRQEAAAAEEQNRIDEVHSIRNFMLSIFNRLPAHISEAGGVINKAEKEFDEGAFAPFWDEIEQATKLLAEYQHGIERIREAIPKERSKNAVLLVTLPLFSLPMGKLPETQPTVARLQAIVRKAQKDFHFSSIFEQRKTNQILVAGFGSLVSAINNVGSRITTSIRQLSADLSISLDNLSEQVSIESEARREHEERVLDHASADAEARRRYEESMLEKQDKQIKLLDNRKR